MGTLSIVATPIGNLEDITLRALRVLREADFILCEDTRVTGKLLSHFGIEKPMISYHQHSDEKKVGEILELLRQGKNLAFVTDAGTPGISDPGNELISRVFEASLQTVRIVPIPGSSALGAIASIAGFPMDKFMFLGFPPAKKGRKKFFEEVAQTEHPVIFYESPYRILKSLTELRSILDTKYRIPFDSAPFKGLRAHQGLERQGRQNTRVVVGRELTKKFETVYRGTIEEVLEQLKGSEVRGEFVVALGKTKS